MKTFLFFIFLPVLLANSNNSRANIFQNHHSNNSASHFIKKNPKTSIGFIENKGQIIDENGNTTPNILFKTSCNGIDMYITTSGISYIFIIPESFDEYDNPIIDITSNEDAIRDFPPKLKGKRKMKWCRLDMNILGSKINKKNIVTEKPLKQGTLNYYLEHCPNGIKNVMTFQKITVKSVYPGIDWIIYADDKEGLKYDFVVHPKADPSLIKIEYKGAKSITKLNGGKMLKIETPFGDLNEGKIVCFEAESQNIIESDYNVNNDIVTFNIADYDKTKKIIIDPPLKLVWATRYGGVSVENPSSISIDNSGNVFISGSVLSNNFPILDPGGGAYYQGFLSPYMDVFILKFNNSGVRMWATYYGGTVGDYGLDMALDNSGNVFITGLTHSLSFPIQNPGGGAYYQTTNQVSSGFILKFNNNGVRQWATFYDGNNEDQPRSIITDTSGNIFVTGYTNSTNFPTYDPGGTTYYDNSLNGNKDVFILKFSNSGVRLWATYYGGLEIESGSSAATDLSGNLYITGYTKSLNFPTQDLGGTSFYDDTYNGGSKDAYIMKFSNSGERLWATYYGGNQHEQGNSITTDENGNVYLLGDTRSQNFPIFNPGSGAFFNGSLAGSGVSVDNHISKFNSDGTQLWGTYFGGSSSESTYDGGSKSICVDNDNNIFITTTTQSNNIPLPIPDTCAYFNQNISPGLSDNLILQFDSNLVMVWGTYYYNTKFDRAQGIAVDNNGCTFVAGYIDWGGQIDLLNPGNGTYFQTDSMARVGILKFCPCCYVAIDDQPQSFSACSNDSASFQMTASGNSIIYQWYHNGNIITGANDSIYVVNPVTQSDSGCYYCVLQNSCDSLISDTVTLSVYNQFNTVIDTTICEGNVYYAAGQNQSVTGFYLDSLFTVNNCDSIITTNLTVNPYPVVYLGNDTILCDNDQLVLNAGNLGAVYNWSNGDLTQSITVYEGFQLVWVIVDNNGCSSSDTIQISECPFFPECIIDVPSAFSPNDDGQNDILFVKGFGFSEFEFLLYNRIGELVYQTKDISEGWDGVFRGEKQNTEVYYYILKAKCSDGSKIEKKGNITLLN